MTQPTGPRRERRPRSRWAGVGGDTAGPSGPVAPLLSAAPPFSTSLESSGRDPHRGGAAHRYSPAPPTGR
ncbi:hypothetical protein Sipo8835_09615 [Streptomyces ipomoeae]|uniref:Uncharacterized protein n=1 Tax=Streptomyces ipomoeae TaxID=103232 RepID=A0AAE8W7A4_9ACTN|nr:hypothetical protein Sipo8835_09615 [Streptomyces ipomoeae]